MGGVVGDVVYEEDFERFTPFRQLGEYFHVGKGVSLGLGKYQIV